MQVAWLGIDLGTQGCRVVALDDAGALLASAEHPLRSHRPRPGWHEQDPAAWTEAVAAACRSVTEHLEGRRIGGLSICGTSGTIVLTDAWGRPVTPALMYDDARAAEELPMLAAAWNACAARNGYQLQPTWALPRLAWLLRHTAGTASARLAHCPDVLAAWLTGGPVATDTSHALKSGYDLVEDRWPVDAFQDAGIPVTVLPPVVRPGSCIGTVSAAVTCQTGLPAGTPVYAGMTDGCAAQIASGAMRVGQWNSALGTTFVLKGVSAQLLHDPLGAVYSHRHPDGGWLPGGASSAGAGVLAQRFPNADLSLMDRLAATRLPTDVVRYPLASTGERFPFVRPDAEPFQIGDPADATEEFAALLQGVAFVERLSLAYMESLGAPVEGAIACTGGATHSLLWLQLRADVLGRCLRVPRYPESAVGMAILAAAGEGSVTDAAARMVQVAREIPPRPDETARYRPIYQRMLEELGRRGYINTTLMERAHTT